MYEILISEAEQFSTSVLQHYGVPPDHAKIITEVIIDSELRGYDDHGLLFMQIVVQWGFIQGMMNPAPDVKLIRDNPSTALLDGDGGSGAVAAKKAMQICIEKAKKTGIAAVGVNNSGNIIAPAVFVLDAADAGLIGYCSSNIQALMAPEGGKSRSLGTNPIAYAAPSATGIPFLFDMSCSTAAAAKIVVAARQGSEVQPGLIQDRDGNPTTNPNDFMGLDNNGTFSDGGGTVLPTGGPKGYGMAMVVDTLCGVLTGANFGADLQLTNAKESKPGHFMWVINVEQFMDREEFEARMDARATGVKNSDRKPGVDEILIPGERGIRLKNESIARGTVRVSQETWDAIGQLKDISGVPLPRVL